MDFTLSNEQRSWQMAARKFADEEIRPLSLARDAIPTARETWDWDIIKKGSKLGFRTMAVPKEWGGQGTDFVTQALVMTELAKADSAISKAFSQNWKWSHLISQSCTEEQKQRFLPAFVADDTFVLGKGITEPSAGSDNRMPGDDPKTGLKLRAERKGDEWILNGEKAFIANAPIGKLFFIDARTDATVAPKQGTTMFLVPSDTPGFRIGKVFNKSGWRFYQNGEMIFENARVPHANVVGEVGGAVHKTGGSGGDTTGGDLFGDLELASNALGICDDACESALRYAKTAKQGGQALFAQQNVQLQINKMFMLTEALRSFVMRVAWEHDMKIHSRNAGLAMNYSCDVVNEVTELYMEVRGAAGLPHGSPHRQAGARRLHLEPPRRRQRVAHEDRAPARRLACEFHRHAFGERGNDRLEGADHVQHLLRLDRKRRLALDRVGIRFQQHAQRIDVRISLLFGRPANLGHDQRVLAARFRGTIRAEHVAAPEHRRGAHGTHDTGCTIGELHQHGDHVARIGRRFLGDAARVDIADRPSQIDEGIEHVQARAGHAGTRRFGRIVAPAARHAR